MNARCSWRPPSAEPHDGIRWLGALLAAILLSASLASAAAPPAPARHASLPAASPDGEHIAFCSDRDGGQWEIYVINTDGRGTRRLTRTPEAELVPGWSDGGRTITYTTGEEDTCTLHALSVIDGASRALLTLPVKGIRLSNAGQRVAYTVGSWTRNRIVVANLDGSEARAITDSSTGYFNLAWSPDDRLLAVTRRDSAGLQVWVMAPDGTGARAVTHFEAAAGRPQWPAWSPDGHKIAVQSGTYDRQNPAKSTAHIWVIDVETGAATRLAPHARPYLDETPSWLADGKHIVFQSTRAGPFDLWVMRSDGTGARRLTR